MFINPQVKMGTNQGGELSISFVDKSKLRGTDALNGLKTEIDVAMAMQDISSETGEVDLVDLDGETLTIAVGAPRTSIRRASPELV